MIKCGVCGSENEAAALFCGTCGSPLSPVDETALAEQAKTTVSPTPEPDEAVVPGKDRGARRDLGIGGGTVAVPDGAPKAAPEAIADLETASGAATITCGVCGTINDATRTYCRKCANELKPAAPPPPPPPPAPVRRKISPLALGLGGAAIVVAIALVAVLVLGGGKPGASLGPSAKASPGASGAGAPSAEASIQPTASAPTFTETELTGKIAFARCHDAVCEVFVRDVSDGSELRLTKVGGFAADPAISNDGTQVAYQTNVGLRIKPIGGGDTILHSAGDSQRAGDTGKNDINPSWSPDDTELVWAASRLRDPKPNTDLEIRVDGVVDNGASTPITQNDVMDHDPVFTPDGKFIVWVQGEGDDRELKMVNRGTKEITDLTTDSFADEDPAVSPDGTEVVFASKRGGDGSEYDLFILNIATLEITPLPAMPGDEHDPAWSPGGRYIVFSAGAAGSKDLFILDRADMSTMTFTAADGSDLTPSWR